MRWMAMPVVAALLSVSLWSVPAIATPAKSVKAAVVAKAAKTTKTVKVSKPVKVGKAAATAKTPKIAKASQSAKTSKAARLTKAGKTSKKSKASKIALSGKATKAKKSGKLVKGAKSRKAATNIKAATALPLDESHEATSEVAFHDAASERIYDGLLPTEEEKIVMPVVKDTNGRAECVQLLKSLMAAPRTLFWKEGRKLKASWDRIQPGTAIATFIKGRYPQTGRGPGTKHAAIFLRATATGIYVFDQFAGRDDAQERFIPWHHPRDPRPSNNATAYSTVRW